jgi:hypothetical protein
MYTPTRAALLGKTTAELVHMLRLLGADSQGGESKESLVNKILLWQKQEFKPDVKPVRKPIEPLTEARLAEALKLFLLEGMTLSVADGCWNIAWGRKCRDSGTLMQPIHNVVRCAQYLKPRNFVPEASWEVEEPAETEGVA